MKRRSLFVLLILLAAILGLRLHWFSGFHESPLFQSPAVDEALHWHWAEALATGQGSPEIPYFRAPLYAWYLSVLHHLPGGLAQVRAAGLLLGLLNLALLIFFVGRRLSSRARMWLLALGGLDASWIYFEPMLLIPHLLLCCLLLSTGFLLLAAETTGKRRLGYALTSGLALGLACIARPNALLLTPVLPLLLWFSAEEAQVSMSLRRVSLLLLVLGMLLPIGLVAGINRWPTSGVLLASQGGVNFYIGNNATADGHTAALPGVGNTWERSDASLLAAKGRSQSDSLHRLSPGEESDWYYTQGRRWLLGHPAEAAQLYWRKLALLLAPVEIGSNTNPLALSERAPVIHRLLRFSWWLLLVPGLLALALGFPRQRLLRRWCLAVLGLWSLSLLLFFVNSRFRLPLHPFLHLPAAAMLADPREFATRLRTPRGMILSGLLLILLSLAALSLPRALYHSNTGWQALQEGNAWQRLQKLDRAAECYQEAMQQAPSLPGPRLNLGRMHHMAGRLQEAAVCYKQELELDSTSVEAWNNLAGLYFATGRYSEALSGYLHALRLRPAYADANWNLGLCHAKLAQQLLETGDTSQARDHFQKMLQTSYDGAGIRLLSECFAPAANASAAAQP